MSETATSRMLEASLPHLERALAFVRRRHRLSAAEAEELRSEVHVCLLRRDALRSFRQESSLQTYLVAIAHNALRDLRARTAQRWRPSIEAKRLGASALRLEELLVRDGVPFEQAVQILRVNYGFTNSDAEFQAIRGRLPVRDRRRFVSSDVVVDLPSPPNQFEILTTEQSLVATRISAALERAIMALGSDDRLVLKLHFYDGLTVAEIARLLDLHQKALYRRIDKLLADLRRRLVGEGFSDEDVHDAISSGQVTAVLQEQERRS